jgi:4,4'-diaponeurosporenoate glycosyltransferase
MILAFLGVCALTLAAGNLLLRSIPLCPAAAPDTDTHVSIIIPARNEEQTLPRLLESIRTSTRTGIAPEVIVVDDSSIDTTAATARTGGAIVFHAAALPSGWTGKSRACALGAERCSGNLLLFLDADTWFIDQGLQRLLSAWAQHADRRVALSLLPFHVTRAPYEELSLFFNLLMAFGAGGFGAVGQSKLFGQCLLVSRTLYADCGGHAAVRGRILENLAMADRVAAVNGRCVCLGGRDVLEMRMFPQGIAQLCESWSKAFADGAAASDRPVLLLAVAWLAALCSIFFILCFAPWPARAWASALYLVAAAQVYWFARQVGAFRLSTALLYPVPLLFFFGLFANSLLRRMLHRQMTWRGRRL